MTGWLQFILTGAFLAGLMGGAHCAAMCGGIVGLFCKSTSGNERVAWSRALAYNGGRISSYMIAGALAGALGQGGLLLRGGPLLQHMLMLVAGATLLVTALYVAGWSTLVRGLEAAGGVLWRVVQPWSRRFMPADTFARTWGLGMVWGWLPCGMVYAMLLTAIATADPLQSALVMLAFGAGTLPNLLGISWFANRLPGLLRRPAARYAAALLIALVGMMGMARAIDPSQVGWAAHLCHTNPGLAALLGWQ